MQRSSRRIWISGNMKITVYAPPNKNETGEISQKSLWSDSSTKYRAVEQTDAINPNEGWRKI